MLRFKKQLASTSNDPRSSPTIVADDEKTSLTSEVPHLPSEGGASNVTPALDSQQSAVNESAPVHIAITGKDDVRRRKRKISGSSVLETRTGEESTQKKFRVDEERSNLCKVPSCGQRLLALTQDVDHLNPLHCFVRRNIQLFLATQNDVEAPAPGRKKDILPNQIGIRCIHCLHLPTQDRVKRAVCYPSVISRIYHCVSDMKIDHFPHCSEMPQQLKQKFLTLKEMCCSKRKKQPGKKRAGKGGASSTARYYVESAKALGIVQRENGLFLETAIETGAQQTLFSYSTKPVSPSLSSVSSASTTGVTGNASVSSEGRDPPASGESSNLSIMPDGRASGIPSSIHGPYFSRTISRHDSASFSSGTSAGSEHYQQAPGFQHALNVHSIRPHPLMERGVFFVRPVTMSTPFSTGHEFAHDSSLMYPSYLMLQLPPPNSRPPFFPNPCCTSSDDLQGPGTAMHGPGSEGSINATRCLLAMPEDSLVLNELHCFVRSNIEVFSSTKSDIAAPAPGRKSRIVIGQVGIRCVHCCDLPYKDRVKRAMCYPPTVGGIYHCVSNMKFDHFEACRGIPEAAKKKLLELKGSCNRKGGSQSANCTAKYYFDAAEKLGLIDTPDGIRFRTDSSCTPTSWSHPVPQRFLCEEGSPNGSVIDSEGLNALVIAANQAKRAQSVHPMMPHSLPPQQISVHQVGEEVRISLPRSFGQPCKWVERSYRSPVPSFDMPIGAANGAISNGDEPSAKIPIS